MIFRESLIISKLRENGTSHDPVGGICIDVQTAQGTEPLQRKFIEPDLVEKLDWMTEEEYWGENAAIKTGMEHEFREERIFFSQRANFIN